MIDPDHDSANGDDIVPVEFLRRHKQHPGRIHDINNECDKPLDRRVRIESQSIARNLDGVVHTKLHNIARFQSPGRNLDCLLRMTDTGGEYGRLLDHPARIANAYASRSLRYPGRRPA
ncbi:MAG: hypothetical protein WCF85_15260 [Rhodospirillaceae bacterium]